MRRKIIILISVLAIIAGSFVVMRYLSGQRKPQQQRPPEETKLYVKAVPVIYSDNEAVVFSSGRLVSNATVELSAEVQGRLLPGNVPLKEGQHFRTGDLLAKIYNDDLLLSLKARKSGFLTSIANSLPDLKIDFPDSYARWMDFFEKISINNDLPELPEISNSQEKVFLASRGILNEYYSIRAEEVRLRKYYITAPFNGTFRDVYLEAGSVANPGTRLASIISTDKMEMEVPVDYHDRQWLKIGDRVKVFSENPKGEWSGSISRISGFVDPATQSVNVFVGLDNTNGKPIVEGQYFKAQFEGKMVPNSFVVPRGAIFNSDNVFTVVNNRLMKKTVTIHHVGQNDMIISGIEEGTLMVTEPLLNASENSLVEILRNEEK